MNSHRHIDIAWLALVLLTLGSAFLSEMSAKLEISGLWLTLVIAAIIYIKGRIVIDYFLEIELTRPIIKVLVRFYIMLWPLVLIFIYLISY